MSKIINILNRINFKKNKELNNNFRKTSRSKIIDDLKKIEDVYSRGYTEILKHHDDLWSSQYAKILFSSFGSKTVFDGLSKAHDLSPKETVYIEFFSDFIENSNNRIYSNMRDLNYLMKEKKYLSGMYLLRAFTESALYDLYVFTELYLLIKKGNIKKFVDLFCKANFSSSVRSFKVTYSRLHDKSLNSLIGNFEKKKIHINDAIRFYKKFNLKKFMNDYKFDEKEISIIDIKDSKRIKDSCIKLMSRSYSSPSKTVEAYSQLCEIIHPNSYYLNNEHDKESIADFKKLYLFITDYSMIAKVFFNMTVKIDTLSYLAQNKDKYSKYIEKFTS